MLRRLHGLAGLVLAIPLIVVAVSGTVLSLEPVGNHLTYPTIAPTSVMLARLRRGRRGATASRRATWKSSGATTDAR